MPTPLMRASSALYPQVRLDNTRTDLALTVACGRTGSIWFREQSADGDGYTVAWEPPGGACNPNAHGWPVAIPRSLVTCTATGLCTLSEAPEMTDEKLQQIEQHLGGIRRALDVLASDVAARYYTEDHKRYADETKKIIDPIRNDWLRGLPERE